jgi:hypothetical protein
MATCGVHTQPIGVAWGGDRLPPAHRLPMLATSWARPAWARTTSAAVAAAGRSSRLSLATKACRRALGSEARSEAAVAAAATGYDRQQGQPGHLPMSAERRNFEALKAWASLRGARVSGAVAFDDPGPSNVQPGGGFVSGVCVNCNTVATVARKQQEKASGAALTPSMHPRLHPTPCPPPGTTLSHTLSSIVVCLCSNPLHGGLVAARDIKPFEALVTLPAGCALSLDDGGSSDALLQAAEVRERTLFKNHDLCDAHRWPRLANWTSAKAHSRATTRTCRDSCPRPTQEIPEPLWALRLGLRVLAEKAKGEPPREATVAAAHAAAVGGALPDGVSEGCGDGSAFWPYVASLPPSIGVPMFFAPEDVKQLQYPPLVHQVTKRWMASREGGRAMR